jgi:hypothetical protein
MTAIFQRRVCALPLGSQWPALALANGLDESVERLVEIKLAGLDQDEPS